MPRSGIIEPSDDGDLLMNVVARWIRPLRRAIVALALALATGATAAAAPDLDWQRKLTIGAPTETDPRIAVDASTVFVAGAVEKAPGPYAVDTDQVLSAYDAAAGDLLWREHFDIPEHEELVRALAADHGLVVVGGASTDLEESDHTWIVRAHDARTGALRWSDQASPGPGAALVQGVAIGGGRVFAGGSVRDANDPSHWLVRAYDAADGHVIWEDQPDDTGPFGFATRVAFSAGRLIAVGVGGPQTQGDWVVRVYDAKTGRLLWRERLDVSGSLDLPIALAVRGRHLFVGGSTVRAKNPDGSFDIDWLVRSYDTATGVLRWQDRFDLGGREDSVSSMTASSTGVVVAGSGSTAAAHGNLVVRTYRPRDGAVLWSDQVEVSPTGRWDVSTGVGTLGGKVVVSSATVDGGIDLDWLVRVYQARNGSLVGEDRFDLAGGNDIPSFQAIATGANRAFVLGEAQAARQRKLVVRAYDLR